MIQLGVRAQDKITGFAGIVTGRAEYLYGCIQYCLVPEVLIDGKIPDHSWFDEGRVAVIGAGVHARDVRGEMPGGPQPFTPQRS
jgi:hypothetical protein